MFKNGQHVFYVPDDFDYLKINMQSKDYQISIQDIEQYIIPAKIESIRMSPYQEDAIDVYIFSIFVRNEKKFYYCPESSNVLFGSYQDAFNYIYKDLYDTMHFTIKEAMHKIQPQIRNLEELNKLKNMVDRSMFTK